MAGDPDLKLDVPATVEKEITKKKHRGLFSWIWNGLFSIHGDDFEKRLKHISKEEAAIFARTRRSQIGGVQPGTSYLQDFQFSICCPGIPRIDKLRLIQQLQLTATSTFLGCPVFRRPLWLKVELGILLQEDEN